MIEMVVAYCTTNFPVIITGVIGTSMLLKKLM